jgi:hypothetical protein
MLFRASLRPIVLLLLSIFVRNRSAFLVLVGVAAALKLILSAVAPASFDLRDIITLVASGHAPIGPWLLLYPPLYNQTASHTSQVALWPLTASLGSDPGMAQLSLLFRLPVFLFDLATMIALYYVGKKLKSPVEGRLMGLVWFLNPFAFFGVELLGLPDVACVFLITLSFLLLLLQRPLPSAAALALGAFIKLFPIFLLPPLLVYLHLKGASRRLLLSATFVGVWGFVAYLAWVTPYGFEYLITPTPVTELVPFLGGIPNTVNPVTFGMLAFYFILVIFLKKPALLPAFLSTFLVYYLLAAPGPQYFIWILPLIAIDIAFADRLRALLIAALLTFAFIQWFLVSTAFLTPSGYSLLMFPLGGTNIPSFSVAIGEFLDSNLVGIIILPLVSSATYACALAYTVEQVRSSFRLPKRK